jgi:hypothetical protein
MPDLHADIFEKLPEDFVGRMTNWAASLGGGKVTTSNALYDNIGDGKYETRIPTLMGEAKDTDRAVRALRPGLQEVVTIFWRHTYAPIGWMATATPSVRMWKLGTASFRQWLDEAHMQLQQHFARTRS